MANVRKVDSLAQPETVHGRGLGSAVLEAADAPFLSGLQRVTALGSHPALDRLPNPIKFTDF
jgi:hypothetical protein